jgi:hypothetical protein
LAGLLSIQKLPSISEGIVCSIGEKVGDFTPFGAVFCAFLNEKGVFFGCPRIGPEVWSNITSIAFAALPRIASTVKERYQ